MRFSQNVRATACGQGPVSKGLLVLPNGVEMDYAIPEPFEEAGTSEFGGLLLGANPSGHPHELFIIIKLPLWKGLLAGKQAV